MRFHHLNAEIADFAQIRSCELRNGFSHLPKNIFDRVNAVLSGTCLDQIAQDLPIIPRLAGSTHGAI